MKSAILEQVPSAWKANYGIANWLVSTMKPDTIVDLGVDYGFSSYAFAEQNIGTVYAVDWFQGDQHAGYRDTYEYVSSVKQACGYNNITIIKADFGELSKNWALPIDILHIDGEHTYEAVSQNYADWLPHVVDNGVILLHDTVSHIDTVGKFFNELDMPKYNFTQDSGLGILTYNVDLLHNLKSYIE